MSLNYTDNNAHNKENKMNETIIFIKPASHGRPKHDPDNRIINEDTRGKKSDLYPFFIPLKRLFLVGEKKGSFAKNVFLFRLKNDLTGVKKLHFVCGG